MRINSRGQAQLATFDGQLAGEGLAIFLSQGPQDIGRYRFVVKAMNSQMTLQVGMFFSSPPNATTPNGGLSRMIAGTVCPGVTSWAVEIKCMNPGEIPHDETADVTLLSSKCCTAPIGVSRVAERYTFLAGDSSNATTSVAILPGQTIKSWTALATSAGGQVTFPGVGLGTILVPNGNSVSAEPGTQVLDNWVALSFINVIYFIELLESA